MLFSSWLRNWKRSLERRVALIQTHRRKSTANRVARRKDCVRPRLEALEDRLAPATLTVNSTGDTVSGTTSTLDLREAILLVNSGGTATDSSGIGLATAKTSQISGTFGFNDTIEFDTGLNGQIITLTGGELLISQNLTISGPGAGQLAVSGNNASRVFEIDSGVTASLSGLTVENGDTPTSVGGGILNEGTLTISSSTLVGNTAGNVINGGEGGGAIYNGGTLTVNSSTIVDNTAGVVDTDSGVGGGILNYGTLTVSSSTLVGNYSSNDGGGIFNDRTLTVSNSTLANNTAGSFGGDGGFGGGIANEGALTVSDSNLYDNSAKYDGGGIFNDGISTLMVSNSTLVGNTAGFGDGGGIYFENLAGSVPSVLTNDTITANRANTENSGGLGGGIWADPGSSPLLTLNNTIVAGNFNGASPSTIADDIAGPVNGAYNLIGTGGSGGLQNGANGNQVGVANPGLATLDDYGGPTQTMALLPGSPAIDAGSNALAIDANGVPLADDQRGFARVANGTVDVGAVEAQPVTFTVSNTNDSGPGSLRQYVQDNNLLGGGDTITFAPGLSGTITLTGGELLISQNLTIRGPGAEQLAISGNNASSVFSIGVGAAVELDDLTITEGYATEGGGIYNQGNLSINNSTLADNTATYGGAVSGLGGGIYNGGTTNVSNSTLAGNNGAGIFNSEGATANLSNSTLTDNTAPQGGGILNEGTVNLSNSTLSGNTADDRAGYGGAISNEGTLNVTNSTLTDNTANREAGGIFNDASATANISNSTLADNKAEYGGGIINSNKVNFSNSIVAGNTASSIGPDLYGNFISLGHNLIGITDANSSGFTNGSNGDIVGTAANPVDPKLASLADYGGPTQTMALLPGSPAIDAGSNALAIDANGASLTADQRGFARVVNGTVDIGAFEAQPVTFTVTNTNDSGPGSLRQYVQDNNLLGGGDTITFAPGLSGTITLTGGELLIGQNLTIRGPGAGQLAISGNNASRVFEVASGITASLSGLTIENGAATGQGFGGLGGGILNNHGTLTVNDSTLVNNNANNGGGAIENAGGTLTVNYSTLTRNTAQTGGAIENGGTLTVNYSTLASNSASEVGGAIDNGGVLTVNYSTLAGNSATGLVLYGYGGGIYNAGGLALISSTLAENSAEVGGGIYDFLDAELLANDTIAANRATAGNSGGQGGGIWANPGSSLLLKLNNTIVAGNFNGASGTTADDIAGPLDSASAYNLIGTGGSGGLQNGDNGNQVGVANPGLAPLDDYGGPTQTIALLSGSPAIDAGSNALAIDTNGVPLTADQRGFARVVNGTVDVGAFEDQATTTALTSSPNPSVYGQPVAFTASVTASSPGTGEPTGTVTFLDGSTVLGSSTLAVVNGQAVATLTVSSLARGSHSITAQYNGGTGLHGSDSAALTQTINPAIVTWVNPNGGDWDTGSNWSTGMVPDTNDAVRINRPGVTVTHSANIADSVYSLNSNAAIEITSGSLSLSAASEIDAPLTISGGAALEGQADLTVTGLFTISAGTVSAAGETATLTLAGGALFEGSAVAAGYSVVIPTGQTALMPCVVTLVEGARFENYGTLDIYGVSHGIVGGAGTPLDNYGTVATSVGDSNYVDLIDVPFNNYGSLAVQQNTLRLGAGGNAYSGFSGSTITGTAGTTLIFDGSVALAAGSVLDSAGAVLFAGGASVAGSYSAAATAVTPYESDNPASPVAMTGTVGQLGDVALDSTLDLSGASLSPAARSLSSLEVNGGTLLASGDLTVTGLSGLGGTVQAVGAPATLTLAGGASFTGYTVTDGYTLVLPAGQAADVPGILNLAGGARLENYGTLTLDSGNGSVGGDAAAALDNYGSLIANTSGSGYPERLYLAVNNYGSLAVADASTLLLGGAYTGAADSTITGTAGTTLIFDESAALAAGSALDSAGAVLFADGASVAGSYSAAATAVTPYESDNPASPVAMTGPVGQLGDVALDSTLDLSGASLSPAARSLSSLEVDRGTLLASGDLTVTGLSDLGGTVQAVGTPATLTLAGGASFTGYTVTDGYTLVLPAGQAADVPGILNLAGGARLENYGTLALDSGNGSVGGDAAAALDNYGSLIANTSGSGYPERLYLAVNNYGSLAVADASTLLLGGAYTGAAGSTVTGTAGTTLIFGGTTTSTSRIQGDSVEFEGTTTLLPSSDLIANTLSFTSGSSLNLPISGGTPGTGFALIQASTDVSLGGQFNFSLAAGYAPRLGDTLTVIDNQGSAPISNTFQGLAEGQVITLGGYQFQISYVGGSNNNDIALKVIQAPATTTTLTSSANPSLFGQQTTLMATVTSSFGTPTGSVDFSDTTTNTDLGSVALSGVVATLNISTLAVGSHAITATYSGDSNFQTSNTSVTQTVNAATAGNLQQQLTPGSTITVQTTTPQQAQNLIAAANGLDPATTPTSTLVVDLGGQTIQDSIVNVPPQVTVQFVNGTFIGGSPALIVTSGEVIVRNSVFQNATDAPTILVTGGSLILRDDTIQESTGYSDAAVEVTGGTVDLGTADDPGGNAININGSGAFVTNTTATPIAASGTAFTINGTPLAPDSLSGIVFKDFDDDGQVDFGEQGIAGVTVTLTGTDFLGNPVSLQPATTDSDGAYIFANLQPGSYSITETQPAGYNQGINTVGTAGGSLSATDQFFVSLAQDAIGLNGLNYNFGEQPQASGGVQKGQTAGIGFWNNKNGQALIKSFNGGLASTQLAAWLADTLPHIFGVDAGGNALIHADGSYFTNAEVAARFQQDFVLKGVKLDAQVLATALSVYATNATLDDTGVAAQYGFTVSGDGVGTAGVNVGSNGDAFAVANNTVVTVLDLLKATDAQAVEGLLYNGDAVKRKEANSVYGAINDAGS